jgi:hypothetical protein
MIALPWISVAALLLALALDADETHDIFRRGKK